MAMLLAKTKLRDGGIDVLPTLRQSYYQTVSKEVSDGLGLYVGAPYSEFEDKILFPATISMSAGARW